MISRRGPETMVFLATKAMYLLALIFFGFIEPCSAQVSTGNVRRFDLRIENGKVIANLRAITVRRGDAVELAWSADQRTTLHLHGYDIETTVDRDTPGVMAFTAHATGRFAIEVHSSDGGGAPGRHRTLMYLEVHPR